MKSIKKITSILMMATALCFSSCNLDEKPYAIVGPSNVGDSNDAVNQWVTGVYSKLNNDMFKWNQFPRVLEIDCDYISGPDWAFSAVGSGNFQADDVTNALWNGGYHLIDRANVAIRYIEAMSAADERIRQNGIAECKFLKAMMYFWLVRAYGEIPLFDDAISFGADSNQPRRSFTEVYAEIEKLLTEAMDPATGMYKNTDAGFTEGHASAGAAAALLVKTYCTMASAALPAGEKVYVKGGAALDNTGTYTNPVTLTLNKTQVAGYDVFNSTELYTKAATLAKQIMSGTYGSYDLLPFSSLWKRANYNKTEHMFMLNTISGDENYGQNICSMYSGTTDSKGVIQTGLWIGNRDHWYKLFDKNDYRINEGVMHRWQYNYQVDGNYGFYYPNNAEWSAKVTAGTAPFDDGLAYIFNKGSECLAWVTKYADVTDQTQDRSDAYWPFLRYADVILLYAEAINETSPLSQDAFDALNKIRTRSNATPATKTGAGAYTTKEELRSAIIEERAKEFACEGDRRWDLIRWGIYLDAMNAIGNDECGNKKTRENRHLLYPIPQDEVLTNKNINSNNPGWS